MHKNSVLKAFAAMVLFACALACGKDDPAKKEEGGEDTGDGKLTVVDGKVTFYVDCSKESPVIATGQASRGTKVQVNGKEYAMTKDAASGKYTVTVDASVSGAYDAVLINNISKNYYGTSPMEGIKVPYAQFYKTTKESIMDYPMYASYTEENGNTLVFKDGFAMIDLCLKGSASITSVKVQNRNTALISGFGRYIQSKGQISLTSGLNFAVLNTTEGGANTALSDKGTHFYVMISPGKYPDGLDVTVCDADHRMMEIAIPGQTIAGNQVVKIEKEYAPDADLIFYEGFDNCVWGGNYVAGTKGYAPVSSDPGTTGGSSFTGYETAGFEVPSTQAGTGFFQSNTWSEVSGYKVSESHKLSESYLKSRNLWDYGYLFRSQEYQGYISVGAGSNARGIFRSAHFKNVEGVFDGTVSFDFCLKVGFDDALQFAVSCGGVVKSATIDGKEISMDKHAFTVTESMFTMPNSSISIPTDVAAAKEWHHVEMQVERMTSGTQLYLTTSSSNSGNHGVFLDNIVARKGKDMERGTLRVLYWNIQNGMWADEANKYDNFVAFVKRYDPDVCIWCESVTIYKTNTGTGLGNSGANYKGYLPASWPALASRYGHKYTAIGGTRDNYPQTITSKYPITTLLKITNGESSSKPIAHGAGLHQITVNGRTINFLTLHTWPQGYGYGVSSANQEASKAAHEGDYYREYEMNYVIGQTYNSSAYSSAKDWIFCGDFNSRSRKDNWYYNYESNSTYLLCQDVILNKTDLKDVIAERYPGCFMASTYGTSRIDYIYASPSMYSSLKNSMIIADHWTDPYPDRKYGTSFTNPSDHRPVLADFTL